MLFEHLLGNEPIKAYLRKAIESQRLPHALLFAGPSGVGKSLFAKQLSSQLLQTTYHRIDTENHPDFHPIRAESKSGLHSIDTLRCLIDEVHSAPFEAFGKVFLIYDAERMQTASANAILKTLEEPNPDTTLILLTEHANEILPTIRSRCVYLPFKPIPEEEISTFLKSKGHPEHFVKRSHGSLGRALELMGKPGLEQSLFPLLSQKQSYPKLLLQLEKIEALIEDEDPVKKNQNGEYLLTALLMWYRDQHARRVGVAPQALFFPEEGVSSSLPTMERVFKTVEEARLSLQRNIKFSVCMENVINNLYYF